LASSHFPNRRRSADASGNSPQDGFIDPNRQETSDGAHGIGLIFNVAPGSRILNARLAATGELFGSFPVSVQAGKVTIVTLGSGTFDRNVSTARTVFFASGHHMNARACNLILHARM